jgi:hypothetical protein
MLHEWLLAMFARTALFAVTFAFVGCSKPQAPVQIHEPSVVNTPVVEAPVAVPDKPEVSAEQIDPAEFAQVVHTETSTFVVLSTTPDIERWAKGTPSLISRQSPVIVRRDVDTSVLPKMATRLVGRSMRLVGSSGEVCQGTIAAPFLMSRVEPHFGERSHWEGEEDDNGVKAPPLSDERVAEIAWDMISEGKLLVAELQNSTGDCQKARFARAVDLEALPMTAARTPSSALTQQAMNALRKLPAYEGIEKSYQGSSPATPSVAWTESQGATVEMLEFSTSKGTYVWVSAAAGEACSGFFGRMNVLWKVAGTNAKKFDFETIYEGDGEFSPHMLMQLPGDEAPSLIGHESMLRKDQKVYDVQDLHVPFLDCPC